MAIVQYQLGLIKHASYRRGGSALRDKRRTLLLESLESRHLLATITVDTWVDEFDGSIDDGDISLRDAIAYTNVNAGHDTITFATFLDGGTLLLNAGSGQMPITDSLTIDASGLVHGLTIDANDPTPANGDGIRIFHIDDENPLNFVEVTLHGLTLTGGDVAGHGGAIRSRENLTIIDSQITGNYAADSGGGIYSSGAVTIQGSTLEGNTALGGGGGMRGLGGVEIQDSTFSDNFAGGFGGGIYVNGSGSIHGSTISGNTAYGHGGGITAYGTGGSMTIQGSTVSGNLSYRAGGGVSAFGNVAIQNSTVSDNSADHEGGGVMIYTANLVEIESSTISGNSSREFGGGVFAMHDSGVLDIRHTTIADNLADSDGSGLGLEYGGGIFGYGSGTISLNHTVVGNNTLYWDFPDDLVGTVSADFCLIESNAGIVSGSNNIFYKDPLLGPLADHGGASWTHALLLGSPAIGAGDPSFAPPPHFDQRGTPFDRVLGGQIDIGAYESPFSPPGTDLVVDTDVDEVNADFGPGNLSLREAVLLSNIRPDVQTITFDPALNGGTIALNVALGHLPTSESVTINASSLSGGLTIDASDPTPTMANADGIRVFYNSSRNVDVELRGLTLTGGDVLGQGGAIRSFADLSIVDCHIVGNHSAGYGGGISGLGDTAIVLSVISGNLSSANGGGIFAHGAMTIDGSTISDNTALGTGGGIQVATNVETLSITNSTIFGNSAGGDGGGIWANGWNDIAIQSSTVSGNMSAEDGGGIYAWRSGGSFDVRYTTIADNVADSDDNHSGIGGGIAAPGPGNTRLVHTLLGNNSRAGHPDDVAGTLRANFCLIEANSASATIIGFSNVLHQDPVLSPLAPNGGATLTHALLAGSPAINAGDGSFRPPPHYDQRGAPFVRDFFRHIDIGAFESQPVVVDADFNDDGLYDYQDIDLLVVAIAAETHGLAFDLNSDGLVNLSDRDAWLAQAGEINLGSGKVYLLGDATLDGVVDGSDFGRWNANKFSPVVKWSAGDFNADGVVDGSDFGVWNEYKFQRSDAAHRHVPLPRSDQASERNGTGCTRHDDEEAAQGVTRKKPALSAIAVGGNLTTLRFR